MTRKSRRSLPQGANSRKRGPQASVSFARRWEADDARNGDPVRALAGKIAAIDHVDIETIDRPPAQSDLPARLGDTACVRYRRSELAKNLCRESPDIVGRAEVDAGAIGHI